MSDDHDILVVSGASYEGGTLPQYREQLRAAGIPYHVETISIPIDPAITGSLNFLRRMTEKFSEYRRLVFTDAFDVTFFGTREDVIAKIPLDRVLLAAEKNCFPEPLLYIGIDKMYPGRKEARYANGGMICGTPQNLHDWVEKIEKSRFYMPYMTNQGLYNILLIEEPDLINIDWKTELFFCLHLGYPELDFERGVPVNRNWGTHPAWMHGNGAWPTAEMWEKYRRSLA